MNNELLTSMMDLTAEEASELAEVCIYMNIRKLSYLKNDLEKETELKEGLHEEIGDIQNCITILKNEKIIDCKRVMEYKNIEKKRSLINKENVYVLLGCSCNRLTKMALKVNRIGNIYNPTPLSYATCIRRLTDEVVSIELYIEFLKDNNIINQCKIDEMREMKMERWKERLETINRGNQSIIIYRNKSVEVKAARFMMQDYLPDWFMDKVTDCTIITHPDGSCHVKTLEGVMKADFGDYIIQDVDGEVYPCKPDIFEKIYEPVLENNLKDC